MQRTAKARFSLCWVSPAKQFRGSTTCAGRRLGFRLGVLCRVESYGKGFLCSALIGGVSRVFLTREEGKTVVKWFSKILGGQSETTSDETSKTEFIEGLISAHQRRLQKLKERQASPADGDYLPPEVQIEIEDLEGEIQQLKATMESESGEREELARAVAVRERRLEILQKTKVRQTSGSYEQEIREIEEEIQKLQSELEQLNS